MSQNSFSDSGASRGFLRRHGAVIGGAVVVLTIVFVLGKTFTSHSGGPPPKPQEMVMIRPLPPPPPPPPQQPPPEQKQQMMEQTPVNEDDIKPVDQPPDASPALGTNIQGNGAPDGFGLSGRGGGFMGGGGGGGAGGSRFGWYAAKVTRAVSDALRQNSRTANAGFSIRVRIWSDLTGRVTRVRLADSTGNSAVDAAIRDQVLTGFQLPEAPPDGMPMPIMMRLTARRPD